MDIPMIGNHASKVLAKQFGSSPSAFEEAVENDFDFSQLPDFGETLHQNIHQWFAQEENRILWEELQEMVTIQTVTTETHSMDRKGRALYPQRHQREDRIVGCCGRQFCNKKDRLSDLW